MSFPPSRDSVAALVNQLDSGPPDQAKKASAQLDSLLYPKTIGVVPYEQYAAEDEEHHSLLRGSDALAPLVDVLYNGSTKARIYAIENLSCIGDKRVCDPLLAALGDDDPTIRSSAARACGWWPQLNADARLIALLDDPDCEVACAAMQTLGKRRCIEAATKLTQLVSSKDWTKRKYALWALGDIRQPSTLGTIRTALRDNKSQVRKAAQSALASFDVDRSRQSTIEKTTSGTRRD